MDESSLLERVFLRVGSADSDEQLENVVNKFLVPVLLKLSSQEEGVRKKVMELLVHVNKRVKSRPAVQLPVSSLLDLYNNPESTSFQTNFAMIYIKMGFPRMGKNSQVDSIPALLNSVEGKPQPQQESILQMVLSVLGHLDLVKDSEKRDVLWKILDKPSISKVALDFMLDVLLLPYGTPHPSTLQSGQTLTVPPAMNEAGFKRASGDAPWKAEDLEAVKLGIVKFISSGVVNEQQTVLHLIVAAADTRFSVANAADSGVRKIGGVVDWNDTQLVSVLFQLFLGTGTGKDKDKIKPELRRKPACTRLRLKIFPYLIKSREATHQFPASIQVTFEGLFGESTNSKLKGLALQFIHQMIYNCPEARLAPISPILVNGLTKVINDTQQEIKQRSSALVALGKLGQKLPQSVTKDMAVVQMLFGAMNEEDPETRMAVQEALSIMAPAFKHLSAANAAILEALLATSLESKEYHLRLVAVQYAAAIFPADHVSSRYLLLLATGDAKEEVANEAKKLLYSSVVKSAEKEVEKMEVEGEKPEAVLPDFVDMVKHIANQAALRLKSGNYFAVGKHNLAFNPGTFTEVISYLRLCLAHSAGMKPTKDLLNQPKKTSSSAKSYVRSLVSNSGPISTYIDLAVQFLTANPSTASLLCLLETVAGVPDVLSRVLLSNLDVLKPLLGHSREEIRDLAAELIAVVICHALGQEGLKKFADDITRNLKDKPLELQSGVVTTLGFCVGRQTRIWLDSRQSQFASRQELECAFKAEMGASLKTVTDIVINSLFDTHPVLLGSACLALGEIGRCGPVVEESCIGKCSEKLSSIVLDAKMNGRIRERAALAAGCLSVGQADYPERRSTTEKFLLAAQDLKDVEVQFTLGEAITTCALGMNSANSRDPWTVREEDFKEPAGFATELDYVLRELIAKYVPHTHPNVKQASAIWLLALVKECSARPEFKARIPDIQRAFMSLLADGNDLVQDVASKGLGLVYDCCTSEQQSHLVGELVGTLTTGKRTAVQVTDDTKVFEEGALGSNPSGGQLSTYRELCSLASDLNQPDLIYRFMHLANHNAIWNSKRGAAFGFSSIAKKAGEQLAPYLSEIVPKLYRYQFDPNPRVQQAMASIWAALVTEQTKTVDLYFLPILDDVIKNLTSNLWRVRESACAAVCDLLRGRTLDNALDKVAPLWTTLFRVVDDIKESVRKAAQQALRALSKVCIKMGDPDTGKNSSERAVQIIIPVLLEHGITSNVEEVRAISLETLTKMVKSAGKLISNHLAQLIVALLEATQAAESQTISYLSVRLGDQHATQEKFDMARISAARSSPLFDTINHCIQFVNDANTPHIVSALVDLIKGSHGLTTKGGAAHVICLLAQQCSNEIQPFAGKIMAALVKSLSDRNVALKKCYAVALGHLVRVAKESSVAKLLQTLETWYIETEDDNVRTACMHTLQAMVRHNSDVLKSHTAQVVPLTFLGKHTLKTPENESLIRGWEEVWMDVVPGSEAGLRLHLSEVIAYLQRGISSPSWKLRAQSAAAMGSIADILKGILEPVQRDQLIRILLAGLSGRTWDGKHHLLQALALLCTKQRLDDDALKSEIVAVLMRESKKEALPYRVYAIESLGSVIQSFDVDMFHEVFRLLSPLFDKVDTEDDESSHNQTQWLQLQEKAIFAMGKSFPTNQQSQGELWKPLIVLLLNEMSNTTRPVQLAITTSLNDVVDKSNEGLIRELHHESSKILTAAIDVPNYTSLRSEGLKVLVKILKKVIPTEEECDQLREIYGLRLEECLRDPSPEVKSRADEAKRLLN